MVRQKPADIFLSCSSGGVPAGVIEGVVLTEIEKVTGHPLHRLIQGAYASSSGSTILTPILIKNPAEPCKALFTASQSFETFKAQAPVWVSGNVNVAMQLLSSFGIKIPFNKSAFLYDVSKIGQSIENQIGQATMQDVMTSYFISAHNITAPRARDSALLYHKTINEEGRENYNPSADTLMKDLIIGTTAVPGLFKSASIAGNAVCDFGHLDDGDRALVRFMRAREKKDVHFIAIGPPRYHGHFAPERLDKMGIIRQSLHLARNTGHHSYSSTISLCEELIGSEFVHDLSPDIHVGKTPDPFSLRSILDVSPQHVAYLEDMGRKFVLTDAFKRVCDMMGENYQARQQPRPEYVPTFWENANKKLHAISDGVQSWIFGSQQGGQSAPTLH